MTNKQIELASKIVKKYLEKYPQTNIFEILNVSSLVNKEVIRYGECADKNVDTIIDDVHNIIENGTDYDSLFDLFDIWPSRRKEKNECQCKQNAKDTSKDEKQLSMEDIANAKQMTKHMCSCNSKKTWVSDAEELKTIKVLVPGVNKENILLTVTEDKILVVTLKDVVIESAFVNPDMKIEIDVNDDRLDIDEMHASLDLGILTIEIPKFKRIDRTKTFEIH